MSQHAISGLSFLIRHIWEVFLIYDERTLIIDLKYPDPCPTKFRSNQALVEALISLHKRFVSILTSEGFTLEDLAEATATFEAENNYVVKDAGYMYGGIICRIKLISVEGRTIIRG
jgi:hypothetical protein